METDAVSEMLCLRKIKIMNKSIKMHKNSHVYFNIPSSKQFRYNTYFLNTFHATSPVVCLLPVPCVYGVLETFLLNIFGVLLCQLVTVKF
jgi:hypothetical protein